jgi:hypothetical protein
MKSSDLRAGRRLLQILLPVARAQASNHTYRPMSGLGRAQAPYLRIANVEAVLVYQAPKGGWHGDVLLHSVPPGVPNVLGTPVERPCPTRDMAVDVVTGLLAQIIGGEKEVDKIEIGPPIFLFHGYEIALVPELLAQIPGYETVEHALIRLAEIEKRLFPHGVPRGELNLGDDAGRWLLTVLHMAACSGVFRYPPKEDTAPTEHGPRENID